MLLQSSTETGIHASSTSGSLSLSLILDTNVLFGPSVERCLGEALVRAILFKIVGITRTESYKT